MDWSVLHTLNNFLYHHDAVEDPLLFYVNVSEALFIATLAIVFVAASARRNVDWRRIPVAAVLSAGLALAVAKLLSEAVDRTRPFVADPGGVHLFSAHSSDPGFPSDHATAAFAIAVTILLRRRAWGFVALLAATVLSVGRVAIGVHYPTDVIAGAALGTAAALALWFQPVRRRLDAVADWIGGKLEPVLDRGAALIRGR